MNILDIKVRPNNKDECFQVHGTTNEYWVLCTLDDSCPAEWKKEIASMTGEDFSGC